MKSKFDHDSFACLTSELQLQNLCLLISERGFKTGSRVWGVHSKDSDYDYVMAMSNAYNLFRFVGIEPFKEPKEDYACCFISLKYHWPKGWVNLVVVPGDDDLMAWKYATSEMHRVDPDLIKDKKQRTKYFGWLLTEYYSYIPKGKHYKTALEMWGSGEVPR